MAPPAGLIPLVIQDRRPVDVGIDPVVAIVEILIEPHIPLASVMLVCVGEDRVSSNGKSAGHAERIGSAAAGLEIRDCLNTPRLEG